MSTVKKLVYDFMKLSHLRRITIAIELGLHNPEKDKDLYTTDQELYRLILARAVKNNALRKLKDAIEKELKN